VEVIRGNELTQQTLNRARTPFHAQTYYSVIQRFVLGHFDGWHAVDGSHRGKRKLRRAGPVTRHRGNRRRAATGAAIARPHHAPGRGDPKIADVRVNGNQAFLLTGMAPAPPA
jgi:hypothetical protein